MRVETNFESAIKYHREGNLQKAEEICRAMLKIQPDNCDVLHFLGIIYYQCGDYSSAIKYIEESLKQNPCNAEAYYNLGNVLKDIKQFDKALICYQKALENDPGISSAHLNSGVVLREKGLLEEAVWHYRKTVQLDPDCSAAFYNLGIAFQDQGLIDEAITNYQKAVDLNPLYEEAYLNLGSALQDKGMLDQAVLSYEKAILLNPTDAEAYNNLGGIFLLEGRFEEALGYFKKAIAINPGIEAAYSNMGAVLREMKLFDDAILFYKKALQINPEFPEAHHDLGVLLRRYGKREESISAFNNALKYRPGFVKALLGRCMSQLPIMHIDEQSIQITRKNYHEELAKLLEDIPLSTYQDIYNAAEAIGVHQPYFLACQGFNDRELQKLYGSLVYKIMARRYPRFAERPAMPPISVKEPLRIGIVSGFFNIHSVWKIPISGWIKNLDKQRFSLYGYYTGHKKDKATDEARNFFTRFVEGCHSFENLCHTIAKDNLHILLYPEIGQDPVTLKLAALNLAPIQCSSALGHPETSGLQTIDYCLSSDLMEPPDADDHYTERLIRLPNLSFYYTPLEAPAAEVSRTTFNLRPHSILYFCAHSYYTHLPQYDEIYPRIARELNDCQFVFIADNSNYLNDQFLSRIRSAFHRHNLNASRYIALLPHLDTGQYNALNRLSDVRLDTPGWSGCNSTFEAIACNLPVVTLPGALMRQRHSAGILNMMDLKETIATSVDDYINIAVALGRNTELKRKISEKIAANKHRIYRDITCVNALEDFFERAVKQRQA